MSALDDMVSDLDELISQYQKMEGVELPTSVLGAVKDGWELTVDGVAMQVLLAYPAEQRMRDKTRCVKLDDVQQILAAMENDMVSRYVLSPGDVIWNFVATAPKAVYSAGQLVFDALTRNWFQKDWVQIAWQAVRSVWKQTLDIIGIVQWAKSIENGLRARDKFAAQVEKKALPQRNAQRCLRRKRTRK